MKSGDASRVQKPQTEFPWKPPLRRVLQFCKWSSEIDVVEMAGFDVVEMAGFGFSTFSRKDRIYA